MSSSKVPRVIDFSDYLSGDPSRIERCASAIGHACRTQGFFQIVNHPIPKTLQEEMFRMSKAFFQPPLGEKINVDKCTKLKKITIEATKSCMAKCLTKDTKPDLKEGHYVAQDLPLDHPQVLACKFAPGPNVWPDTLGPHFRETCMDYLNQISDLTEKLMEAIGTSLGYDSHYFDDFCREPMAFYKLLHYPPQPPDADALQRGTGAHRAFGVITLLLQGDVPELEIWDEETKSYYPAPPIEGAYFVNLGNLFEQWTNNKYISNMHRVINKPGSERYSISFIYNGNPDFVVKCIEFCRGKAEDEKYAAVPVGDYVRQKYKDIYGRVGIYQVAEKASGLVTPAH